MLSRIGISFNPPRLRAHRATLIAFLTIYALGFGATFWIQAMAQARLDEAFHLEHLALSHLQRLTDLYRQLESLTDRYLVTGAKYSLAQRRKVLRDIRNTSKELGNSLSTDAERYSLRELDLQLTAYLAENGQWISKKRQGSLSAPEASQIVIRETPFPQILNLLHEMRNGIDQDLWQRRVHVRRLSVIIALLILLTGLASSAVVVWMLTLFLINPIASLEEHTQRWRLGQPWTAPILHAGPEITKLGECMSDMAGRLNIQYQKEVETVRIKSDLVSLISHEFNNSLSVIQGLTELLQSTERTAPARERQHYYRMLKSNTQALHIATVNMLDMGRLETGQFAVRLRPTDAGEVLRACMERLRILHERKGLHVALALPDSPPPVRGDPEALTLVITNLLTNAIKYTPENGYIGIGMLPIQNSSREIEIYVHDSGIGIAPEDHDKIFTSGYRTRAGKLLAKGFGVGLSLAKHIVEAHGSDLRVDSIPGNGSKFYFRLPIWNERRLSSNFVETDRRQESLRPMHASLTKSDA